MILKSTQTNPCASPLLAGPAELIRHRGRVGRFATPFVAVGESFELAWGTDADVFVHRSVARSNADGSMFGSWSTTQHFVEIKLSNLGSSRKRFLLSERIPVSEIEKLTVEVLASQTRPPAAADKDGLVHWSVELEPHEQKTIQLAYELRRHSDIAGLEL